MIKIEFTKPTVVDHSGTLEMNPSGTLLATFNDPDLQIDCPWQLPLTFTVYKERKDFTDSDYSDPDVAVTVVSVSGSTINLQSTSAIPQVGNIVIQNGTELAISVVLDPRRIDRILRNLLINAIEHAENKDIEVLIRATQESVAVSVRDFGVGLRKSELSRVFDRFWRADPARARTKGGTGLGLSIAQEDAQLPGGVIEVWGEIGNGAQFTFTFPRERGQILRERPIPILHTPK
jgi:light-regulated signal transduction histidine kinase (bacteriophytochrome)